MFIIKKHLLGTKLHVLHEVIYKKNFTDLVCMM